MQRSFRLSLALLTLFTLTPLSVKCQVRVVTAQKIVKTSETPGRLKGNKPQPGDVIEYVVTYRNTGTKLATGVTATLPIPPGMEYVPGSASPQRVMASLDDVHYWPVDLKKSTAKSVDSRRTVNLHYSEYRSLRWELGAIPSGAARVVKARMVVQTVSK